MYQFSLKAYSVVFKDALSKADPADDLDGRILNLLDSITYQVIMAFFISVRWTGITLPKYYSLRVDVFFFLMSILSGLPQPFVKPDLSYYFWTDPSVVQLLLL